MIKFLKIIENKVFNLSIRYKLITYFLLLTMLPIFTLGVIGNLVYSKFIEDEATGHTAQMIEQVNRNIESHVEKMEDVIEYISHDPVIVEFMNVESMNDIRRIDIEAEVRRILRSVKDTYPEIAGILVANENGLYISNELYRIKRNPLTTENWYQAAVNNQGTVQLLSKPIGRNITTSLKYTADDVVSVTKAVVDPGLHECTGVVLIDMKIDTVKKVIESVTFGKNGFVYVMDEYGDIVYAPVNKVIYRINEQWFLDAVSNSIVKSIKNSRYQIIYSTSEYMKWRIAGVFSLDEALEMVIHVRHYTLLIGWLTFVFAVTAILFFANRIVSPVNELRKLMKVVESGNLEVKFISDSHDEIGQLGDGFNNMLGEIKKLINMVYAEQKNKREAELKILQAQIKPHFLYNTLDNIQWMAQEHGADDIAEVVMALTKLFRIGLSKGQEMIRVKDELEHVKSYLVIQKVRYESKLEYSIDFQEEILEQPMLKLTLQPLVENAIYHGIKQKRGTGFIEIKGKRVDNSLYFIVKDNGIGIETEELKVINEMLSDKAESDKNPGYGIFNVNERMKLTFKEGYGMRFSSVLGEGTTVEVWYPIIN